MTKHIKYGGVGFDQKASAERINQFIRELPEEKKRSLFEVAEELKASGLIEITGDITQEHINNSKMASALLEQEKKPKPL